ncbi:abc transporter a family member 7, partial [Nicotiana attenuata]
QTRKCKEAGNSLKNMQDTILRIFIKVNTQHHFQTILKFELPKDEAKISDVFLTVKLTKQKFTVQSWGLADTSMEDVFIKVGEVGELSEIFQWKGEVPKRLPNWEEKEKQLLGEELSDLLLYLVRVSDMCGIDLAKAALRKLELNAIKYPVNLYKGSSKKLTLSTNININNGGENGSEIRYFF